MNEATSRFVLFCATLVVALAVAGTGTVAAQSAGPGLARQVVVSSVAVGHAPLWGGWADGIVGNRDRMIQATAIAIAIAIFILTRSTK